MVEDQLAPRGIFDPLTLKAMGEVPRHLFVPAHLQHLAYEDQPLPIAEGQTISQPYVVAAMTQAARLSADSRVLEVGTGSGYQAAILAHIVSHVFTIERFANLIAGARRTLARVGIKNVTVRAGDGSLGWPEEAPFDAILVTAGAPNAPPALIEQLAPLGRLVVPVGAREVQTLTRYTRLPTGEIRSEQLDMVFFVPLVGKEGWPT
jgi:protein-L-isoaspartate(D-aspartate) O-methyltransferase